MYRLNVAALLFLLGVACGSSVEAQSSGVPPSIVTQAEGVVKRPADRAWITVAVETRDVKAEEARRRNADVMTTVQTALKAVPLPPDAIRTTGFSLSPEFDWNNGRSTLQGYVARNQIDVRIDELTKLGEVIDAANSPRGVALSINGPRFELKDRQGAEREALGLAVRAAMGRAGAMAAGAARSVGPILRIDEQSFGLSPPQPMPMFRAAAASGPAPETPITPGEIEVRVQVTLTVELR